MARLTVSLSPHFQNPTTTKVLMTDVLIALAPATLVSLLFYGWNALLLLLVLILVVRAFGRIPEERKEGNLDPVPALFTED